MKSYEAIYSKGHLVDVKTGKRIFLKRGEKFIITGQDEHFEEKDALKNIHEIRNAQEKYDYLRKNYEGEFLIKIADKDTTLEFGINITKPTNEDKKEKFRFKAVLLEDLYMHSKGGKKEKDWTLCDCTCEVSECIEGELNLFEPLQSKSLNALYTEMVGFYFNGQRNPACNAFKTYKIIYDTTNTFQYFASKTLLLDEVRKREIQIWINDINNKLIKEIGEYFNIYKDEYNDLKEKINKPEQLLSEEEKLDLLRTFLKSNALSNYVNMSLLENNVLDIKGLYYHLF